MRTTVKRNSKRTNTGREEIIWCEISVSLYAEPALEFRSELRRVFRRYTEEERATMKDLLLTEGGTAELSGHSVPCCAFLCSGDRMTVFYFIFMGNCVL